MEMSNNSELSQRPFFNNVNGLRFLGALLVFIFHSFTLYRENWGDFKTGTLFQGMYKIANKGHYGVSLFFVLSGFLITSMLLHELKKTGTISVFHFFMRRILRIWPLYFLLILFGFLLFPYLPDGQFTQHSITWFAFFGANFDEIKNGIHDSLNFLTVMWSVSVEEQFYLVWMLSMALFPFIKQKKYFLMYAITLIICSIVFRFLHANEERTLYFHTLSVISDLAIGSVIAYSIQFYDLKKWVEGWSKRTIIVGYIFGIGLIFSAHILFTNALESIERLIIGIFFAFVLMEQIYSNHSFYKIDRWPFFFQLGELTYGFYLFHCIYLYYWSLFFVEHQLTDHFSYFLLYILICFASTFCTAWLSLKFIERPILKLKRYFK